MENIKLLSLIDLLDLLIWQTTHHITLIVRGATPMQFMQSREMLRDLQEEINVRTIVQKTNQQILPGNNEAPLEKTS